MPEHNDRQEVQTNEQQSVESQSTSLAINTLNNEAIQLLEQIVNEQNVEKSNDLTYLFNQNQKKKTMIRLHNLSNLMDTITDQTLQRFETHPDNITTSELLQGLKVVQDAIERGQKQLSGTNDSPLIQINQQNNEVNLNPEDMPKESRERIRGAVMDFLGQLGQVADTSVVSSEPINATTIDTGETNEN